MGGEVNKKPTVPKSLQSIWSTRIQINKMELL